MNMTVCVSRHAIALDLSQVDIRQFVQNSQMKVKSWTILSILLAIFGLVGIASGLVFADEGLSLINKHRTEGVTCEQCHGESQPRSPPQMGCA
jgi:hypothetical protein